MQDYQELKNLRKATYDCFEIDNRFIPDACVDKRGLKQGRTSLAFVRRRARKAGLIQSEYQELKETKRKNVEAYRRQLEENGSFEYNENELELYKKQLAFVSAGVRSGMIELDLDDE